MRIECPHCSARVRLDEPPDDDTPIRCPECRKKFTPPADDDDRPARKKGRRRDEDDGEKKGKGVQFAIAGGVVALAAIVGVVIVVMTTKKDDPKPVAANTNPQEAAPQPIPAPPRPNPTVTPVPAPTTPTRKGTVPFDPDKDPVGKGGNLTTVTPAGPPIPPQYAELFRVPVNAPPKTIRAADLRPTDAEAIPEVPTFHSLMLARKTAPTTPAPAPKAAKMTQEEVKKACAYIKVSADKLGGTGSGFLVGSDSRGGLVATNFHVVEFATRPRYSAKPATITAVFNSGQPDEKPMKADIVAFDPIADLAILRVEGSGPWPKPLSPFNALPKVTEGVDIQFWGFPLGARMASSPKRNPAISLGKGTVSSFRTSASGKVERVQVNASINGGNSGGPVVDNDGRLVGVVVSTIKSELGSGIGWCVPIDDLIGLMEGRLMDTLFIPAGLEGGKARFVAVVPVMDPLERVDTVYVRRWAGAGTPPDAIRDPLTGFRPFGFDKSSKGNLPGVTEFPLKVLRTEGATASGLGIALGELDVPEGTPKVLLQVASQTFANAAGTKLTAASKPVSYTLSVGDHAVGSDAGPFNQLTANPDALEGQTIVVKARIAAPPMTRDPVQDVIVVSPEGRLPDKMRFVVDRDTATQFDEVVPEDQPRPVRLVCVVGKRWGNGILPVRVARLDFLGRGDRVTRTIPAAPPADDKLAELNRNPARFAGQTLVLKVTSMPMFPELLLNGEFAVLSPSQQLPRNLMFNLSPELLQRVVQELAAQMPPGMIVRTRVTVSVPARPAPPGQMVPLAVRKIELLGPNDRPERTIE